MTDFIAGERFAKIADFVYSGNWNSDCNKIPSSLDLSLLQNGSIIYCHTFYTYELFQTISHIKKDLILITHNSDDCIDSKHIYPNNIKHWFAQNVNIKDSRIESIPLGLENAKWFPQLRKKELMVEKLSQPRNTKNFAYMNHAVGTNIRERLKLYEMFKDTNWVTQQKGSNGTHFESYIDNIYNHYFVFCPQGNGIDTVRLWETLYMQSIPIVKRCINTSFYEDLPICFVDDWEEVTEKFLNSEFDRIRSNQWNLDKLAFSYWKTKIQSKQWELQSK